MRWLCSFRTTATFIFLILCASSLFSQTHGVPASVSSLGDGHNFFNPPGVPASVTSLGPRGLIPNAPIVPFGINHFERDSRRPGGRQSVPVVIPVYLYPNGYDFPIDMSYEDHVDPRMISSRDAASQRPQVIVIDNRGVHDTASTSRDDRAALAAPSPPQPAIEVKKDAPEEERPATLVIFNDGSRKEFLNYAIMGSELIEISSGRMRRYLLADVNLPATIKENNERGVDFRMP